MRILVVGAGVIGSFNAARLAEGGHDVTLLARGRRLEELREREKAWCWRDARTGKRQPPPAVPLVERLDPYDVYDLAVGDRPAQSRSLPCCRFWSARRIPNVLFLGDNAARPGRIWSKRWVATACSSAW